MPFPAWLGFSPLSPFVPVRILCLLAVSLFIASCTSGSSAIVRTLKLATTGGAVETAAPTTPGIRYLRVLSQGNTAYLALGYVEPGADGNTEVWYSAKGEVLRLRNGRLVGTAGLPTDWREVRLPKLPPWAAIERSPMQYQRSRDEMPDYRFDIADTISVHAVTPPQKSQLMGKDASGLHWFEETVIAGPKNSKDIPPSLYAVEFAAGTETVVYGETCLTATLCLAWQRLPKGAVN